MTSSSEQQSSHSGKKMPVSQAFMYGSFLFIVILAYLVPVDALDQYPQLRPFVEFMAGWNTQIRRVGEISGPRSQVNMVIYSMAWCLIWIPVGFFLWWFLSDWRRRGWPINTDVSLLKHLMLSVFALFTIWLVYTWSGHRWPIQRGAGQMIFLSPITSPAWSVGAVLAVVFCSFFCIVSLLVLALKIYRHFKE